MGRYKKIVLPIILFNILCCFGQREVDTLQHKSYDELLNKIGTATDLKNKNKYCDFLILKAKNEKKIKYISIGYHVKAATNDSDLLLKYCDSIIDLTINNSNENYPADAYQLKGNYFYRKKKYNKAIDNYLQVSYYAQKHKNPSLTFNSNYNIGIIKRKLGENEEALKLYKNNFSYAKINYSKLTKSEYLNSISAIANIYNDMNMPDSASFYNKIGIIESKKINNKEFFNHFSLNQGVSLYFDKQYMKAIDSLEKYIPYFEEKKGKQNLSFAYYYCGMSYLEIKKKDQAIHYFKKLDSVFIEKQSIHPLTKNAYKYLISYYKNKKEIKNQLRYTNQLIRVDSILHNEELYLNKTIFKEYDIPKLKAEQKLILKGKQKSESKFLMIIYIISTTLLMALIVLIYQIKTRNKYRKRFKKIIEEKKNVSQIKDSSHKDNVPEDLEVSLLKTLIKFEDEKEFLSKNITLHALAEKLKTNTSYLSKIINKHKNNSFTNYINNLRISYIIEELKINKSLRKFTIRAISDEAGFNQPESFSKAFYKIKGIKPSYFLRELEKYDKNN